MPLHVLVYEDLIPTLTKLLGMIPTWQAQRELARLAAWRPRISVAMNFFVAIPKTPRDGSL